ncbi:hypothetical protein Pmani_005889 [Petrolisthes manimaculis]|uniref:Uncharacterized protein n=1 Tax=Petrolisthes manimaculis TaxID=1843537 RepID=A0AAE1QC00_9EUCA|nr:hypothetical protein Pmani_005889 [Petrolisthes manimaculis]
MKRKTVPFYESVVLGYCLQIVKGLIARITIQMNKKSSQQHYLQDLREFLQSSDRVMQNLKKTLEWTGPAASQYCLQKGLKSSEVTNSTEKEETNEYSEEPLLPSWPSMSLTSTTYTCTIDADTQNNILKPFQKTDVGLERRCMPPPASAGELMAHFTREERLAMYDFTFTHSQAPPTPPQLVPMEALTPADGEEPKELTGLELKKALRDFKRRRQAYRKVSTKDKKYTEVTREIIENMMGFLGMDGDSGNSSNPTKVTHGQSSPKCHSENGSTSEDRECQFKNRWNTKMALRTRQMLVLVVVAMAAAQVLSVPAEKSTSRILEDISTKKVKNEMPCNRVGGMCGAAAYCPKGMRAAEGLCPLQQDQGIECCHAVTTNIKGCQDRGGSCEAPEVCGNAPQQVLGKCPIGEVCCSFT